MGFQEHMYKCVQEWGGLKLVSFIALLFTYLFCFVFFVCVTVLTVLELSLVNQACLQLTEMPLLLPPEVLGLKACTTTASERYDLMYPILT